VGEGRGKGSPGHTWLPQRIHGDGILQLENILMSSAKKQRGTSGGGMGRDCRDSVYLKDAQVEKTVEGGWATRKGSIKSRRGQY